MSQEKLATTRRRAGASGNRQGSQDPRHPGQKPRPALSGTEY